MVKKSAASRGRKGGPGQLKLAGVRQRPPTNGNGHGGRRAGAGRKPKNGVRAGVPHRPRPRLNKDVPVHVTIRLVDGLPRLRSRALYPIVQRAMAMANRMDDVRFCHLSLQQNLLHLIVEANHRRALSRGMQRFKICFAKNLNRELGRTGTVFADRYHVERLETPLQVKNALAHVLGNGRTHGDDRGPRDLPFPDAGPLPIRVPRSWLLTTGWKKHGLISPWSKPGARSRG